MAGNSSEHLDRDAVVAATKALAEATSTLTRMLGKHVGAIGEEVAGVVAGAVAEGVREAKSARGGSGETGRRRERVERTRTDLLDAMAELVAARGYEGASVGEIAAAAGYTKGAVYANFGSKEDLFVTLARREADEGRLLPTRIVESGETSAPPVDSALLGLEVLAYAARQEDSREDLRPVLEGELDRIARLVRDARPLEQGRTVTREDRDTAIALVAVAAVGDVLAGLSDEPHVDPGTVDRLTARLLARNTGDPGPVVP